MAGVVAVRSAFARAPSDPVRARKTNPQKEMIVSENTEATSRFESGPLASSRAITKLPARDLDRARAFYRDRLGLTPVEEREGGLRYLCASGEFHLFLSTGSASGESTQIGFEVEDIDSVVADLRARGVVFEEIDALRITGFEVVDGMIEVEDNYPSKGTGERGAWFRDSEGNILALGQPIDR
jgi:catechol 2,3-dioxygenase-like lactoylglutathione lyase family enzyme